MNIYYQGIAGAYSHGASLEAQKHLFQTIETIEGKPTFTGVWKMIQQGNIGVLPIENSYAGSIHQNIYNFLYHDYKIIGELDYDVHHCLLGITDDLSQIERAYSHPQALAQCREFLLQHNIEPIEHADTADAARWIKEKGKPERAAIASSIAGEIYGLNTLDTHIQDQDGNTTKFLVVAPRDAEIEFVDKKNKTSVLFATNHLPAALYKCLGAFATNAINLTKIESMPSQKDRFSYMFFVSFEGSVTDPKVQSMLEELEFFTTEVKVLGSY